MTDASGPFPSLLIRANELSAQGAFAVAQAEFLQPDEATVAQLAVLLREHNTGIVAHFYMDPELQGVLSACPWPHIKISDSLMMADEAVKMAAAGIKNIVVLGVDFMSENVRAILDAAGHDQVAVLRVAAEPIGCSLAASAEAPAYSAYLERAAQAPHPLHVIYINTSLEVKARAHHRVPTMTCTSSNVVKTVLQAFAQIPELTLWFGPDTYMGENLAELFRGLSHLPPKAIAALHPQHDAKSVAALCERLHYFKQGTCVVHHMFGEQVAATISEHYAHSLITAHLEVPGEMFRLALAAQRRGDGVVGSTSNILGFIAERVQAEAERSEPARLRFVLGTEAGMITSIVRKVQQVLRASGDADVEVEIIFPVAAEAVAKTDDPELQIVPGVASGEGCTTAGGCATCPYMKMNSLDALLDLLPRLSSSGASLAPYAPRQYTATIQGRSIADLGGEPILHMRSFQQSGRLPERLVEAVLRTRVTR